MLYIQVEEIHKTGKKKENETHMGTQDDPRGAIWSPPSLPALPALLAPSPLLQG